MSSDEEAVNMAGKPPQQAKRKRMRGSCDVCRQKKIRCDSSKRQGKRCTNCVATESDCTHLYMSQKVGQGYRASRQGLSALTSESSSLSLGQLRDYMDTLLKTILHPTYQAPTNAAVIRETLVNLARYARALEAAVPRDAFETKADPPPLAEAPLPHEEAKRSDDSENPTIEQRCTIVESVKRSLVLTASSERYFGPASSIAFVLGARKLAQTSICGMAEISPATLARYMRPHFWTVLPWDTSPATTARPLHFPEPDLLKHLVDLYFDQWNALNPLLNRNIFEKLIAEGHHFSERLFGMTVLAVCALGARYSDDPRVLLEGTQSLHSCGYKWFRQLELFHNPNSARAPSLYEIQTIILAAAYLEGSSTPEKAWYLGGLGIRAAYDIGLNRRKKGEENPTVDGELRKRAFWILYLKETEISVVAGRPACVNTSDFDIDLPIDCDDARWYNDNPAHAFHQPHGTPSKIAFFNAYLNLSHILANAFRFLYSAKRPEPPPDVTVEEWEKSTMTSIEAALNAWVDTIPDHLRWDEDMTDPIFFNQSVLLHVMFYNIQILVHRPLMIDPTDPKAMTTSLAICLNAAQGCIRVMDTHRLRGTGFIPQIQSAVFQASVILLVSCWRFRNSVGREAKIRNDYISAVVNAVRIFKYHDARWHIPGRFCDMLMAFLSINGLSLPSDFAPEDDPTPTPPSGQGSLSDSTSLSITPSPPRTLSSSGSHTPQHVKEKLNLPLYTTELSDPFFSFSANDVVEDEASYAARSAAAMRELHSMLDSLKQGQGRHFGQNDVAFGVNQAQGYPSNISHIPSHQGFPSGFAPGNLGGAGSMPDLTDPIFGAFSQSYQPQGSLANLSPPQAGAQGFQWEDLFQYMDSLNNPNQSRPSMPMNQYPGMNFGQW